MLRGERFSQIGKPQWKWQNLKWLLYQRFTESWSLKVIWGQRLPDHAQCKNYSYGALTDSLCLNPPGGILTISWGSPLCAQITSMVTKSQNTFWDSKMCIGSSVPGQKEFSERQSDKDRVY